METIESKRVQYRKYLDRSGVVDALRQALLKLYSEDMKPDDAVRYVRKYMCLECPDEDAFEKLQAEVEEANARMETMEKEMDRLRDYVKIPPDEQAKLLAEELHDAKQDKKDQALVFQHLTDDVIDEYRETLTPPPGEAHIFECIIAGLRHPESKIGAYACDSSCYSVYNRLFDPIIHDYHNPPAIEEAEEEEAAAPLQPLSDWGNVTSILDPEQKYILQMRCSAARNIAEFPFFPKMKGTQYKEVEEIIRSMTHADNLQGAFEGGVYLSYGEIEKDKQQDMISRGILFDRKDPVLLTAGCYTNWPMGRGVFHTPDESFLIWVNAEDHVQVISTAPNGELGNIYSRLYQGMQWLESNLMFIQDPNYGYLTACPSNVGTGFHATVRLRLPLLAKNEERLQEILMQYILEKNTTGIDAAQIAEGVMEVTNHVTLGLTEIELVNKFEEGVNAMLAAEQELEGEAQ